MALIVYGAHNMIYITEFIHYGINLRGGSRGAEPAYAPPPKKSKSIPCEILKILAEKASKSDHY